VLSRDHAEVDDGWLCDKGRFAYQAIHVDERVTHPMVRDGGELRPVSWERALEEAAGILRRAGERTGAVVGNGATSEEGFLVQGLVRDTLGSADIDSRTHDASDRDAVVALNDPALQATVPDLEFAHTVLVLGTEPVDEMPIVDLRIRKGVRRNRVNLAVATSRPSSLDPNAKEVVRFAPGDESRAAALLGEALSGGTVAEPLRALVELLRDGGEDVVILYGERVLADPAGGAALIAIADALGLRDRAGAGLLGVPAATNGRGLREAGVLPDAGPGLAPAARAGRSTAEIGAAAAAGDLTALWLVGVDPLESLPHRATWEAALDKAAVIAHAGFLTPGVAEHAQVIFPAESYAEQDGTIVHPDGRIQRLRQAIARQGDTRPAWWVLRELAQRLGADLGIHAGPMASQRLFDAVPFYAGLTLDEIGGRGVRWSERDGVAAWPAPVAPAATPPVAPAAAVEANGRLRLGTFRSIWAGPEVRVSPALKFVAPRARVELSPADAKRLQLFDGDKVLVGADGRDVGATVALRAAVPAGSAFLEGNLVEGPLVEVRKAPSARPAAVVGDPMQPPHPPEEDVPLEPVRDRFPTPEDVLKESGR
jgi:NADH-quinone oxidoreductase subunit G